MRTYDRAEEKNVIRWHEARVNDVFWYQDYQFDGSDLRPFWEPDEDNWAYYYNDIDINDVRKGKLMTLLLKLRLRSPLDVIDQLNW